jgi:anti-sigma factor RsiW
VKAFANLWKQSELACRDVVEAVNDYLDDVLATPLRASFEQHLHACPWCLTYLDQMRQTVALTAGLARTTTTSLETELPPELEVELRAAFRSRARL